MLLLKPEKLCYLKQNISKVNEFLGELTIKISHIKPKKNNIPLYIHTTAIIGKTLTYIFKKAEDKLTKPFF